MDMAKVALRSVLGTTFVWNATSKEYDLGWNTKTATSGYLWRLGVTLDDGQTYYVTVGLSTKTR